MLELLAVVDGNRVVVDETDASDEGISDATVELITPSVTLKIAVATSVTFAATLEAIV